MCDKGPGHGTGGFFAKDWGFDFFELVVVEKASDCLDDLVAFAKAGS